MGELLAALGQAWPRLLIYPGGASALLLAWLICRLAPARSPAMRPAGLALLGMIAPLTALSLLPMPYSRPFPYGPDLLLVLALLDLPLWLRLSREPAPLAFAQRAALPAGYVLLLLALALLVAEIGSFDPGVLAGGLPDSAAPSVRWRYLAGLLAWQAALALALLLPTYDCSLGLALRTLGHIWLAMLPWPALLPAQPWLAAPAAVMLLFAALRLTHLPRTRPGWRHSTLIAGMLILLILLGWQSAEQLATRLS
jgi:hypothetical protein